MYAGRVAEKAGVRKLFKSPQHPYTKGLLRSIPQLAKHSKTILPTITGQVPSLMDMPNGCRFAHRCPLSETVCRKKTPKIENIGNNHTVACHLAH
jgi:peptide/nickel transport system ATP-binding protein